MKVIIVGGVAGGASAAARIRRLDEQAEIIVFERSGYVSYANCGLPYYIGGVITDPAELTLQTPESFFSRFRIDVRVRHEVTDIDTAAKTVTVKKLDSGEVFTESYDKLLLSPGAKPTLPPLAGVEGERIFTLRTVEDTFRIREFVEKNAPKSAVLAGGGFIGLEMAENLRELGLDVTIVQRPRQVMAPLDADMAVQLHKTLERHGVALRLGSSVEGFVHENGEIVTLLKDEEPLRSDMVILAIGVTPDSTLGKKAGLQLGQKGSIVVNDRMETSAPDVYGPRGGGGYYDVFNSAVAINGDGDANLHHKMRLVIGVESMPFTGFLDKFVDLGGITGQLGRNDKATVFEKSGVKYGPAICYEGIYGDCFARFVREGADHQHVKQLFRADGFRRRHGGNDPPAADPLHLTHKVMGISKTGVGGRCDLGNDGIQIGISPRHTLQRPQCRRHGAKGAAKGEPHISLLHSHTPNSSIM